MEPAFLSLRAGRLERLAGLIFPAFCVTCSGPVAHAGLGALCESCWKGVHWLVGPEGLRQGPAWHFDRATAPGPFEGALRDAVHAYKFSGRTAFARPFARLLAQSMPEAELLCWVPTSAASLSERGFDPLGELGRALARSSGLPAYMGLRRSRPMRKQAELGREERWLNAKGAFAAGPGVEGRRVLLVDDVITTGATLSECAAALKRAGAREVTCIALASGGLRGN